MKTEAYEIVLQDILKIVNRGLSDLGVEGEVSFIRKYPKEVVNEGDLDADESDESTEPVETGELVELEDLGPPWVDLRDYLADLPDNYSAEYKKFWEDSGGVFYETPKKDNNR